MSTPILLITIGVEVGIVIGAAHATAREWIRSGRWMALHAINSLRAPI